MNFGQVLETHLGWVAKQGWEVKGSPKWAGKLPRAEAHSAAPGTKLATPVFDGALGGGDRGSARLDPPEPGRQPADRLHRKDPSV